MAGALQEELQETAWRQALQRAENVKVLDDPKLIRRLTGPPHILRLSNSRHYASRARRGLSNCWCDIQVVEEGAEGERKVQAGLA